MTQPKLNKALMILKKTNDFMVVFALHEKMKDALYLTRTNIVDDTRTIQIGLLLMIGLNINKYDSLFTKIGRIREYFINIVHNHPNNDEQEQIEILLKLLNDTYIKYKKEILYNNILGNFLTAEEVNTVINVTQNKFNFVII